MPFINGRYHINPAMGHALDAAREADSARLALEHDAHASSPEDDFAAPSRDSADSKGPIHRIEIEAAETVPAHSGRAAHGFVARVHRLVARGSSVGAQHAVPGESAWQDAAHSSPLRPETHVFTDHRDLLDFLRDELVDSRSRS